ncbi:YdcH family protein [Thauera sp.]|uniref:YdcH family protein n=1 Tax=Thauera sp. TaxID=1905334 RepID=UPI0039E400AB
MSDETFEDVTSLHRRLDELRIEHQDLDDAIKRLAQLPLGDELMLRRLKKRKLILKDRMAAIERLLEPDERA